MVTVRVIVHPRARAMLAATGARWILPVPHDGPIAWRTQDPLNANVFAYHEASPCRKNCMDIPVALSTNPLAIVRPMVRAELGLAIDLAADEGWNPGLHDAETFWAADPGGFFAVETGDGVIGTFSVVRYGDDFAFGGLYVLRPGWRGRGLGLAVQRLALEIAGDRNLGIDGVFGMQARYATAGFVLSHRNLRFEGVGGGTMPSGLVPLREVPFETVVDYDRARFPGPRDSFLSCFLSQQGGVGYTVPSVNGSIAGYGYARPCRVGYKVGPLFADSPKVAEQLFAGIRSSLPSTELLYLDVPEPNADAVALAARHGMREVFGTARMYSHQVPALPLGEIYGITTFELG